MAQIIMYTKTHCPYCVRAKELLKVKGFTVTQEINIEQNEQAREEMMQKSGGRRTVPQIFINGKHVGGCDDMVALNDKGELDALLGK